MTIKFHKAKIKYQHLKWSCVLIAWELLGTKYFPKEMILYMVVDAWKAIISVTNQKTLQSQTSPDNSLSDPNAASVEVTPSREQDREPVPKTCQTLSWGSSTSPERKNGLAWGFRAQADAGMEIEAKHENGSCVTWEQWQTLQWTGEGVVRKWIISPAFLALVNGEPQSGGLWGLPAGCLCQVIGLDVLSPLYYVFTSFMETPTCT